MITDMSIYVNIPDPLAILKELYSDGIVYDIPFGPRTQLEDLLCEPYPTQRTIRLMPDGLLYSKNKFLEMIDIDNE